MNARITPRKKRRSSQFASIKTNQLASSADYLIYDRLPPEDWIKAPAHATKNLSQITLRIKPFEDCIKMGMKTAVAFALPIAKIVRFQNCYTVGFHAELSRFFHREVSHL